MTKTSKIIIAIIILILITGGIWYGLTRKAKEEEVIKIGVLTPLSGPAAFYGENIIKGIKIAKQVINDAGGINGVPIELVVEDSKCDGSISLTAAIKLADMDRVTGIIGQACSAATIPVGTIAQNKGFVLIACAASNPKITESPNVFRVNPNDLAQSQSIAKYLKDSGISKVSILALNDEYGNGLVDEFQKRFSELGGTIQKIELFGSSTTDFKTQITKLETSEFEILFIIASPAQHPLIAKQLDELGKDWRKIAEFNFGVVPEDSKNEAMKGTLYPTVTFDETATENARILKNLMEEKYAKEPDIVTAWGFDSLYVFAKAAGKCSEVNADCIRENLVGLSFNGASGSNSFTEEGEVEQLPFKIIEYK